MRIGLIVFQGEGIPPKTGYFNAYTLADAKKINKNSIDSKTFSLINALGENKNFSATVSKIRAKFKIPENGYDLKEWNNMKQKKNSDYSRWRAQVEVESIRELTKVVRIHPMLVTSLPDIVALNSIFVPLPKMFLETPYSLRPRYSHSAAKIVISSKVSKNQLLKFIEEHWLEINKALNHTDGAEIYISDRDYRIIEFRDKQRLKFGQIAEILAEEVNYEDEGINEDSVKNAYHQAKKKIASLKR